MLKASIVIPTKNGGTIFEKVLLKVISQELDDSFEIIVVDSGSSDQTLEVVKKLQTKYKNLRLIEISPRDFGHGKTRNLGAANAQGEFVIFITQDALPFDNVWLKNLLAPFELDVDVVGVFGKHVPYDDCDIFEKEILKNHFNNFGTETRLFFIEDQHRYETDEGYRQYLGFYSDNSSAMRKSIWEKTPYKDVNFAEDQIWAKEIIEMGYKKAYAPNSIVYHSHRYTYKDQFRRYFDEYKGLYLIYAYKPVKNIIDLPVRILKHTYSDLYFLRRQPISRKEKLSWLWYAFRKNINRYSGAYLGAKDAGSQKLTKLFSREYKIIHGSKK